jgi:glutamate racemase
VQASGLAPDAPIAVFDSGVGGLSVLRAIRERLPAESLLYVADSGHAPYGDRDVAFIRERAFAIVGELVRRGAKEIVIACNTATVVAAAALREAFRLPIVALEPAIKPAVQHSRSGVIGVLATSRTLESEAVARLCAAHGGQAKVVLQACPGLVEAVERGEVDSARATALLSQYLAAPLAAGADTLVLGCTHYAFLRDRIAAIAGPGVALLDSAEAVARQTARRLPYAAVARPRGEDRFLTTGDLAEARVRTSALWGAPVDVGPFVIGP